MNEGAAIELDARGDETSEDGVADEDSNEDVNKETEESNVGEKEEESRVEEMGEEMDGVGVKEERGNSVDTEDGMKRLLESRVATGGGVTNETGSDGVVGTVGFGTRVGS